MLLHFVIDATWRVHDAATSVFHIHFVTLKVIHSQLRSMRVTISASPSFEAFLPQIFSPARPSPANNRIALDNEYVVTANSLVTFALRN